MTNLNVEISLTIKTCQCGAIYAVPYWLQAGYQCPMCANRKYAALQSRFDGVYMDKCRLERIVRGLRGALKQKTMRR